MYQEKFVVVLKHNGKILREQGDSIFLPFGAEYSVLLKNLNNQRALVKIEIDGRKVTGDGGLVVDANADVELERFIDTGDLEKGYRFKFIEKTEEISEHRGDKAEDGIIRIEWWYELPRVQYVFNTYTKTYYDNRWCGSSARGLRKCFGNSVGDNVSFSTTCGSSEPVACASASLQEFNFVDKNDEGITVEGSDSKQKFRLVTMDALESVSHVLVFKLRGLTAKTQTKPIYVSDKIKCKYCGKKWQSNQTFCGSCGARLVK